MLERREHMLPQLAEHLTTRAQAHQATKSHRQVDEASVADLEPLTSLA